MRLLLDTHVFLWLQTEPERLGDYLDLVAGESNDVLVSAASAWEIAIKVSVGRLELPEPPHAYVPDRLRASGLVAMPLTHAHALTVATLPTFADHRDPFDRLLVATARSEGIPVLTADPQFERYEVEVLRV